MNFDSNYILFMHVYWQIISSRPEAEHPVILLALFRHLFDGVEPDFPVESALFATYKSILLQIENNRARYASKCSKSDKSKSSHALSEAGVTRVGRDTEEKIIEENRTENNNIEVGDTLPLQSDSTSAAEGEGDPERNKIILSYALYLLAEGRINAYTEASRAYDYYAGLGWQGRSGPIRYKFAYLRSRGKNLPACEFTPLDGEVMNKILSRVNFQPENKDWINRFRGLRQEGTFLYSIVR